MKKNTGLGRIPRGKVITNFKVTGFPVNAYDSVCKTVDMLAKKHKTILKIGKTKELKRGEGPLYEDFKHMYIIYQTTSKEFASIMEKWIIDYGKEYYMERLDNKIGGGGGRKGKHISKIHMVYIAFK